MIQNVGSADRIIRIVLGVIAAVLPLTGVVTGTLATVLYITAAALVLTGVFRFCGLYAMLGINTCKTA